MPLSDTSEKTKPHWVPKYNRDGLAKLLACVSTHYKMKIDTYNGDRYKNNYSSQLPALGECACLNHSYDRSRSKLRTDAELSIMHEVKTRYQDRTTLNYLSVGSGALMQDFIICATLLLAGYSLCVRLVEPACTEQRFYNAYLQFNCLQQFAQNLQLQFEPEYFPTVLDYIQTYPDEKIHVGHAIDFDAFHFEQEAKEDIVLAYQSLNPNGFFYLASHNTTVMMTPTILKLNNDIDKQIIETFIKTSGNVREYEKEIAKVMVFPDSYINKIILKYVGLFNLPNHDQVKEEPPKPATVKKSFFSFIWS